MNTFVIATALLGLQVAVAHGEQQLTSATAAAAELQRMHAQQQQCGMHACSSQLLSRFTNPCTAHHLSQQCCERYESAMLIRTAAALSTPVRHRPAAAPSPHPAALEHQGEDTGPGCGLIVISGQPPHVPAFNADGCADACSRTLGCNAWTYCDSEEGCGSGCQAYTREHPKREPAGCDRRTAPVAPVTHAMATSVT